MLIPQCIAIVEEKKYSDCNSVVWYVPIQRCEKYRKVGLKYMKYLLK